MRRLGKERPANGLKEMYILQQLWGCLSGLPALKRPLHICVSGSSDQGPDQCEATRASPVIRTQCLENANLHRRFVVGEVWWQSRVLLPGVDVTV